MKRYILNIFCLVCTSFLGVQCTEKLESEPAPAPVGTVEVSLTATHTATRTALTENADGLKAEWEIGDKLYVVAPSGGSLGFLTAIGSGVTAEFSGTVSAWSGTQNLQFYYLGKGATITNGATSFSYDVSTQNGTLAYVATKQLMHGSLSSVAAGTTSFGTIAMTNLNSVAKLDLATNLDETATLTCGLSYSTASLNLATGALTPSDGQIALGTNLSNASAYYMVLIPGTSRLRFSDGTTAKTMYKYIDADRFYCADASRASVVVDGVGDGELPGLFSVSATETVRFSQGNLQYIGSASPAYWKFADNQWDYFGNTTSQVVFYPADGYSTKDRDLFAWGCTGSADVTYPGTSTNYYYNPYYFDDDANAAYFGPANGHDISVSNKSDWGCLRITNGGDVENNGWFTLSKAQYDYLLGFSASERTNADNLRTYKELDGTNGLVILPDGSDPSVMSSIVSKSDLITYNAVFLPAAGFVYTYGSTPTIGDINQYCNYWSCSFVDSDASKAYYMYYGNNGSGLKAATDSRPRNRGYAVRLVKVAN